MIALADNSERRIGRWLTRLRIDFALQRERWLLALPVPLALGISLYHGLPMEPRDVVLPLTAAIAAAAAVVAVLAGSLWLRWSSVALALAFAGFALAQGQTMRLEQPRPAMAMTASFQAHVALVEPRASGARLTLDVVGARADFPRRVRVTARSLPDDLHVGDRVRLRARLLPPSEPVLPGGFDFGRWAYFKGIGAVGYAYGAVDRVAVGEAAGGVAEVRRRIARHAADVLPGETGGVAAALLTGLRGDISDRVWSVMQSSGLAHLLAISGLHIGLAAGTAFLAVRYAWCLWPWLALRVPAHRVAALAALAVAFLYLLLAGAPVPTQRAFMMTGLVLTGMLVDRDAISLRLVALAAALVLAIDPAALFGASFQMSFAAVTALVAFYERWRLRRPAGEDWWSTNLAIYVLGVLVTTLIATAATAPFAAYHFGRLPTYGVLANLVAVPLMAFWIMPLGLLSLLLMPFGLDRWPLELMGLGIDGVLWAATMATSWPGSSLLVPHPPAIGILALVAAGLWAALWRGPLARFALLPAAVAVPLLAVARPPDVVVDREARMVALRDDAGGYVLIADRRNGFILRGWTRALGVKDFTDMDAAVGIGCDPAGCRRDAVLGRSVVVSRGPEVHCDADIVINLVDQTRCPAATTITARDLWVRGAVAVDLDAAEPLAFVYADEQRRPWERQGPPRGR